MKKSLFCHIMGLNLKNLYQIASLFDMCFDMGDRIAGKQDRPSLIIEHPLRTPQIAQNIHIFFTFWLIYEKVVFKLFPLIVPLGPQITKDVNVFSDEKLIIHCYSLLYICLQCDEVFMTL